MIFLYTLIVVGSTGCQWSPASHPTPDSPPALSKAHSDRPKAWETLGDVAFVDTSGTNPVVRLGISGAAITEGNRFSVSDDGAFLAVLRDEHLFVMSSDGTDKVEIASHVTWVAWRPGTHELIFAAYSEVTGRMEWRHHRPDKPDVVLEGGRFPPTLSPSGTWLVGYASPSEGRVLEAIHLNDLSTLTLTGGKQGFSGLQWAGSDTISYMEDSRRVMLLSLLTGERHLFLESDVDLYGSMHWTADGSRVALSTREKALAIWSSEGQEGLCPGNWKPIGWSVSGRFLAMEETRSGSLYVLDTLLLNECSPVQVPGQWARYLEWHPESDTLLTSLIPKDGEKVRVEVWSFSSDKPAALGVVGNGQRASWIVR